MMKQEEILLHAGNKDCTLPWIDRLGRVLKAQRSSAPSISFSLLGLENIVRAVLRRSAVHS